MSKQLGLVLSVGLFGCKDGSLCLGSAPFPLPPQKKNIITYLSVRSAKSSKCGEGEHLCVCEEIAQVFVGDILLMESLTMLILS